MASISVNTGNWALECAAEKYTKQKCFLNTINSCQANKTITHMF